MNEFEEKRNVKLLIEYFGKNYSGWQKQNNAKSIQETIENAIFTLTGEKVNLIAAGRTDAGVHAMGQVANFFSGKKNFEKINYLFGLNYYLPDDIVIKDVEFVDSEFNARFSAKSRKYLYRVSRFNTALKKEYVYVFTKSVDEEKIMSATSYLLGEHDFSAFTIKNSPKTNHVCKIYEAYWEFGKEEMNFFIKANRFLHHMVRMIVGTLLEVGCGKLDVEKFKEAIFFQKREYIGATAPAKGLYFYEVTY